MSDKDTHLKNRELRKRLALLGVAAQRQDSGHQCPDDEQFARLLEAAPGSAEQQRFVDHLSACPSCREKWLVLSEELERSSGIQERTGLLPGRRGLLSLAGSACAVAVGVMLYLSIDHRPVTFEGKDLRAPVEPQSTRIEQSDRVDGVKKKAEAEFTDQADTAQTAAEAGRFLREPQVQQPAAVKSGPSRQLAEAPAERRSAERVLSDRHSFSGVGGAPEQEVRFGEFIDSFLSYCDARHEQDAPAGWSDDILEQAQEMVEPNATIAQGQKEIIDKIVQLLSRSEPVKDTELDSLCREVERLTAATNRPPR